MQDKIIEKIKKLMELGNSSNKNESELALAMAQKLMLAHDVDIKTIERADILDNEFKTCKRKSVTDKYISCLLTTWFNVLVYSTKSRLYTYKSDQVTVLRIAGNKSNVAIAEYVYLFLERSFKAQLKAARKENKSIKANGFYMGLFEGLNERLKESRQKYSEETGLVLVDNHEDEIKKLLNLYTKKSSTKVNTDRNSVNAGKNASANINLRTAVSNSKGGVKAIGGGRC